MQTTHDSISMRGAGVVQVTQPAKGHRFTIDSVLLADFCRIRPKERVLEPGAGTGIVSLLLAKKHPRSHFYPVEVQADLYRLCEENRKANDLGNLVPVQCDIRRLLQPLVSGHFDVIVANPPYLRTGTGRPSPDTGRKIARHDLMAGIESWLDLRKHLKQGGKYNIIFPAGRMAELLPLMTRRKLEPKRARLVHPFPDRPAALILIEAVKEGGRGVEILPPIILHGAYGAASDELWEIYGTTGNLR